MAEQLSGTLSAEDLVVSGSLSSTNDSVTGSLSSTGLNLSGGLSSLGLRGYSAYELAVQEGYEGTLDEWLNYLASNQQNAFSYVTDGTDTLEASTATDTLTIVGGGKTTVTYDTDNKKLTISSIGEVYDEASDETAGLMSAEDKTKLDEIEPISLDFINSLT